MFGKLEENTTSSFKRAKCVCPLNWRSFEIAVNGTDLGSIFLTLSTATLNISYRSRPPLCLVWLAWSL